MARPTTTAGGQPTARDAFADWRASPSHDAAMLSPYWAAVGVGLAFAEESVYGWHWTATFGSVADDPAEPC